MTLSRSRQIQRIKNIFLCNLYSINLIITEVTESWRFVVEDTGKESVEGLSDVNILLKFHIVMDLDV